MMSAITRLQEEALRLLTTYEEHKNSEDGYMRRKAHVDLDRFLMENREVAIMCMERTLSAELQQLVADAKAEAEAKQLRSLPWYRRLSLRRRAEGGAESNGSTPPIDA